MVTPSLYSPSPTRMYSGAGKIVAMLWDMLADHCQIDVMPALGTHVPMTREECEFPLSFTRF